MATILLITNPALKTGIHFLIGPKYLYKSRDIDDDVIMDAQYGLATPLSEDADSAEPGNSTRILQFSRTLEQHAVPRDVADKLQPGHAWRDGVYL